MGGAGARCNEAQSGVVVFDGCCPSSQFLSRDACVRAGGIIVLAVAKSSKLNRAREENKGMSQRGVLFSLGVLLREEGVDHRPNS